MKNPAGDQHKHRLPMTLETSAMQCKHISARSWYLTLHQSSSPTGSSVGRQGSNTVCSSNLGWQGRHCRLLYLVHIGALFCLTCAIIWGSVLSPQSLGGSMGGERKVVRQNKTTTILTLAQHRDQATFGTDLENYLAASVEKWKIKWHLSLI